MEYEKGIIENKKGYPFDRWHSYLDDGLDQYTFENCEAAKSIFNDLLFKLVMLGECAELGEKLSCFKYAVQALNDLDNGAYIIETGEREELCELINSITISVRLNPCDYGEGEGLASEWREW